MNNIELLLPAYAKKQLSDSGGRKVVDKMFDVSLNRRIVEFSGTDRPEFTDFGGAKVCVEAERTNLFRDSDASSDPGRGSVFNATFAANDWGVKYGTHDLNGKILLDNDSGTVSSGFYNTGNLPLETYAVTCLAKNQDGTPVTVDDFGFRIGAATRPIQDIEPLGSGVYICRSVRESLVDGSNQFGVVKSAGDSTKVTEVTAIQIEAGPYPTNYIPTSGSPVTRLAPNVTIEDALPLTGTVAGVVDMVRPASGVMPLWTTGGNINTERSRFYITSGRELSCFVYGLNGGLVFTSFPLGSAGERFQMDWAMSWNESNLYLFIRSGEDQYLYSSSNVINNTGQRSIYLGAQNGEDQFSTRFLIPWHKDETVRTTEEEFEQLFEDLS